MAHPRGQPANEDLGQAGRTPVGVGTQDVLQVVLLHRHSGNFLDGQALYGPYYIKDTANGHTYQIRATNGYLVLHQVA